MLYHKSLLYNCAEANQLITLVSYPHVLQYMRVNPTTFGTEHLTDSLTSIVFVRTVGVTKFLLVSRAKLTTKVMIYGV